MVAALLPRLQASSMPTTLDRVTVTVVVSDDAGAGHLQSMTFHRTKGAWGERRYLRGLHPAVADRLDLWRFEHFGLTRLASRDEVYLFRAVGREQPHDVRLFALGEVRELTPTVDHRGRVIALPELERVLTTCLDDLRDHRSALPPREQPDWNWVVLDVWPSIDVPIDELHALVQAMAPLGTGLGLEEVTITVRTSGPGREPVRRCLRIRPAPGHGMDLRITRPPRQPLRPLDDLTRRVVRARRRGVLHPSELLPLLMEPTEGGPPSAIRGRFEEHDLDEVGRLRPVAPTPRWC